jgi:hypothetical protein
MTQEELKAMIAEMQAKEKEMEDNILSPWQKPTHVHCSYSYTGLHRFIHILVVAAVLVIIFMCVGCGGSFKGYTLTYSVVQGRFTTSSTIVCDSFQMITPKECIFWKDGIKGNIISGGDPIMVSNKTW